MSGYAGQFVPTSFRAPWICLRVPFEATSVDSLHLYLASGGNDAKQMRYYD